MDIMNSFAGRKVWVHCVVNHRVSAFLYLYFRLALKANHEDASRAILPSWRPDRIWREFMMIDEDELSSSLCYLERKPSRPGKGCNHAS